MIRPFLLTLAAIIALGPIAVSFADSGAGPGQRIVKNSCDTPVGFGGGKRHYSPIVFPTSGDMGKLTLGVLVEGADEPFGLQLIYGSWPVHLGEYSGDVYMLMDPAAEQPCSEVCRTGCGRWTGEQATSNPQVCAPQEDFEFFGQVNPAHFTWKLGIDPARSSGTLTQWSLQVEMTSGYVTPEEARRGVITISISYLLLTAAYILLVIQGFRARSYGMPLIGQAALLGITILVVFPGPVFQPCLFDVFVPVPTNFEPGLLQSAAETANSGFFRDWVWRIGLIIQGLVFLQYLLYGKKSQPLLFPELQRKHFYLIAFGVVIAFTVMEYLFVVFYQDYYINESYLIANAILACSWFASLYGRRRLKGLSVSVGWLFTIGTLLLYLGIVFGHMNEAFHDHLDTGYGFIHVLYWLTIGFMAAYSIGLTRLYIKRKDRADGTRPSL